MQTDSKLIENFESFYGEIKTGLIKKEKITLYANSTEIDGLGAILIDEKFCAFSYKMKLDSIRKLEETTINRCKCIKINYTIDSIISGSSTQTLYLPNLRNHQGAFKLLSELVYKSSKEREEKIKLETINAQKKLEIEKSKNEMNQKFFEECYRFHITNNNCPYYELINDSFVFACIYIDKNKNINILKIDANNQEESNAIIPYNSLHYYDTAGNIHYTTDINGKYTSLGGSISGSSFSKGAAAIGTLLFGYMGMVGGALLTHRPSKSEMPTTNFDITSNLQKVDDRSVIVNYYSDIKKQYIDIELPNDIYNFLQTYLPEKKHSIVLEIEKQQAIKEETYKTNKTVEIPMQEENLIKQQDTAENFKLKIQKLKIMHETSMLTDEEYEIEKAKILSQL